MNNIPGNSVARPSLPGNRFVNNTPAGNPTGNPPASNPPAGNLAASNRPSNRWIAPFVPPVVAPQFDANPMQKVAFGFTAFFIFLIYSRLQDFVYYLHIPAITLSLATILMVVSGNINAIGKVPATKWTLALTVLMATAIPFAVWHGGAFETFSSVWLKAVLVYAVVMSSIVIPHYCTRLITIGAFGILCGTLIGLVSGSSSFGRANELNARFGDSNEFAQVLLIGMCMMLGYAATPGRQAFSRIAAYLSVVIMLVAFFRTGSRGGLIGLIAVGLYIFLKESMAIKIWIVVLSLIVTASVLLFLPDQLKYRYAVTLGLVAENRTTSDALAAAGSAQGRQYLLLKSLQLTVQHPLFGVGPGMFAIAENSVAVSEGKPRGAWHETHNMYTQISSENGIPAVICFIAALVTAFRALGRIVGMGKGSTDTMILEASRTAYWVRLALLGMIVSGFFLSIAYTNELQVLIAFSMGLTFSVNAYLRFQAQNQVPAAVPTRPEVGFIPYRKPVRPSWTNA